MTAPTAPSSEPTRTSELGHLAWSAGPGTPLSAGRRFLLLAASTALLGLSNPGVLAEGWPRLALGLAGLALWALAACRVGPWRKTLEWLAGGTFGALVMVWVQYITPPSLLWIFAGWGLYMVFAGWFLRRLLHHVGLPLATALAFTAIESLRTLIPPPIGLSWVRMGHLFAEVPALRGVAAYVGVDGLTFLAAAVAGLVAIIVLRSPHLIKGRTLRLRAEQLGRRTSLQAAWVLALVALAWWLGDRSSYLARFADGPRVLLVQPGFEQERKRELYEGGPSMTELFDEQLALSMAGVAEERAAGRDVDLVVWGETMFAPKLIGAGLQGMSLDAWRTLAWPTWTLPEDALADFHANAPKNEAFLLDRWFGGRLFGPDSDGVRAILGEHEPFALDGVHFMSGVEIYDRVPDTDDVRRANGFALWNDAGERLGEAWKWHLVPGAESSFGWEEYGWARAWAGALMPYVPDFQPETRVRLLPLAEGEGVWGIGGAVCFDNGFDDLFLAQARAGASLHVVVSNEAWYRESVEFDQMIAMTRMWAIESGRSIARAANSGVSGVWLADGSELARLVVDGRDRAVRGTVAATVPVPPGDPVPGTLFMRIGGVLRWISVLAPLALLVAFELLGGRREVAARRP